MVEGQPLQYLEPSRLQKEDPFPFFRPFECYSTKMDRSEEFMMPGSPISTQSDSDNSVSSIEISPRLTRFSKRTDEPAEVQCRWRNCGMMFSSLDQLPVHVAKVHSASGAGGLFYCGWDGCPRNDKGFNARYKMLVHVRTHTNEKPHKCCQCNKSFSRAENLKIHSRSHSGEKPYVCPVPGCNKAYSNSSDRFKHTRTHQVEKPYQCKVPGCPKKYTDPSSLRKHVKTYQHFVKESEDKRTQGIPEIPKIVEPLVAEPPPEDRSPAYDENIYRENVIKHPCKCNQICCVPNCLSSPTDIFQYGALIDMKHEEKQLSWNRYIDAYPEKSHIYPTFQNCSQDMDIDKPLDLSTQRRDY